MIQDGNLLPEAMLCYPFGGRLTYHLAPTLNTFQTLNQLGCNYIVLVRHPADHVVAACNSYVGREFVNPLVGWEVFPISRDIFAGSLDNALSHMITGGYLSATINWMNGWLSYRDKDRSLVLKYEDFCDNPSRYVGSIYKFLNGTDASETEVAEILSFADGYAADSRKEGEGMQYQRGYTGKVGVWRDYFTSEHTRLYRAVVSELSGDVREIYSTEWLLP